MDRVISWFSCGATSAVASRLALKKYPDAIVIYIDTGSEHEDNRRFLHDIEAWLGVRIVILKSDKYANVDQVIDSKKFIRGPHGAPCSGLLKKEVRYAFQQPDDLQVFGFHNDEKKRAERFTENNLGINLWYPLIDAMLDHDDCLAILRRAGIKTPIMYDLGFNNNNCIGCVKAESSNYWNLIRQHFPDVFAKRSEQERRIGYSLTRVNKQPIYLDELPVEFVKVVHEDIQCGLLCEIALSE